MAETMGAGWNFGNICVLGRMRPRVGVLLEKCARIPAGIAEKVRLCPVATDGSRVAYRGRENRARCELCLSIDRRFRQIKCAIRCFSGRACLCRS